MTPSPLPRWHALVKAQDASALPALTALLADAVVFHSPVVHRPVTGKPLVLAYLGAALQVFGQPSFRYVREIAGAHEAMLEFELNLDGVAVNGIDLIHWNADGQIDDFKVMLRPLKAVNAIHERMAATLQAAKGSAS
jgi:hypothetical protein